MISVVPTRADGMVEVIAFSPTNLQRYIEVVPEEEAAADVDDISFLPSLGMVYQLTPTMNLRASWGKTVARPTIREMAPVATSEFLDGDEVVGNPDLVLSKINNYDVRWEWFRRPGEVLAASVFYKELTNPIEYLSFGASNRFFIQPINFENGKVEGFELEGRTELDFLWRGLRGLAIGANYTSIDSSVEVPLIEQESLATFGLDEETRQLQGQPAYVTNANITYDHPRIGFSTSVFYNKTGETLLTGAAVGDSAVPSVYQLPTESLVFRASHRFRRFAKSGFALTFRAKNLLETPRRSLYRTPYGEEAIKVDHITALKIGLSASWSF
jgi:TonB-dependent receptor